jgi:hypothetical protein
MPGPPKIRSTTPGNGTFGWPARLLPSFTDVVILFPLLFMMLRMQGVATLLGDGDTGWHIRTGEWIIQNRQVPHNDIFSFSKSGQPWFAWEWAWDVCFAWIHQLGGLPAVVFVNLLLLSATFVLLLQLVRRVCSNELVSALITLLALVGTSIHWLARPHLISWLFIVIFGHILIGSQKGRFGLLYSLPFLMILWTNLHGAFFVGIALVFAYAVDPLVGVYRGAQSFAEARPYLLCGAACLLVSFINPYTHSLHQHVLSYLLDTKQIENILEFQSVNFRHPLALFFEIFLALGAITAFRSFRNGQFTEAILILVWAHLALVSIRNIPIFILFVAPLAARTVAEWVSPFQRMVTAAAEFQALERLPRYHAVSVAGFALLMVLMAKPGEAKLLRSEYDPARYPAQAVEELRANHVSNIFTDDEWGDYLIYKLYPVGRVFVDGRSDFYGGDFESRYLSLMNVRYDWEQNLANYRVNTVLLRVEAPLAGALKQSPHWKVVYDDGIALIFLREEAAIGVGHAPLLARTTFSPRNPDQGKVVESPVQRTSYVSGINKPLKGEPTQ